jgi:sugar lactone lactonase YvrE
MTRIRLETLGSTRDLLGESPVWDERLQVLWWIDARRCLVHRFEPATGAVRHWTLPEEIGSIALADDGNLLVALEDAFHRLDLQTGETTLLARIAHPAERMRLNDGRTDRAGRFLCGSMVLGRTDPLGVLYQLRNDAGTIAVHEVDRGFATSNSTCFSPDGRSLYFADSHARQVWRYPYDTASGRVLGPREPFFDARPLDSAPDGATVDADGGVWSALVLTGELVRCDERGRIDLRIPTPLPYVTCPCIGGAALDTIYLTTLRDTGNLLRSDHPDAGALLAIHGTGVRGLPEVRFAIHSDAARGASRESA